MVLTDLQINDEMHLSDLPACGTGGYIHRKRQTGDTQRRVTTSCPGSQTACYLPKVSKVPAVTEAVAILKFLSSQPEPMRVTSIVRELELPRSTVYHLLATLEETGFVAHYPEDHTFGLGFGAYELSAGYSRQAPLQRMARVLMTTLKDRSRNSAHLGVLDGREVLYVLEERAPKRPPLVTDVGVRLPAHITASGRALLATMPSSQVRALYPDPASFAHRYPIGPRKLSELRTMLTEVRGRGYAYEHGEVTPRLYSIATAVLDRSGHPLASVAVTYPEEHHCEDLTNAVLHEIVHTAKELARRVGGSLGLGP